MGHCPSCNRAEVEIEEVFVFRGQKWCPHCANISRTLQGVEFVINPSPGRIVECNRNDPLEAWQDCFEFRPKRRILKSKAKQEVTRAWKCWEGDKEDGQAMFLFFGWLNRNRPYFLTFRTRCDPWQDVHCWLLQYESLKSKQ